MNRRLSVFTLLVVVSSCAALCAQIRPAEASENPETRPQSAWLPSPDRIDELAERITQWSAPSLADRLAAGEARASGCRLKESRLACRCVRMEHDELIIEAERWIEREDGIEARGLRASAGESSDVLYAERWRVTEGDDELHRVEELSAESRDAELLLTAASLELHPGDGQMRYGELAWYENRTSSKEGRGCEQPHTLPEGEPSASARSAALRGDDYRIEGFRFQKLPVHPPDYEASEPGPVGGFLPPSVAAGAGTLEATATYLIAPLRSGPQARVAPGDWYGGGVAIADHLADDDQRPVFERETPTLDASLRYSQESNAIHGAAVGGATWGTPYRHVSADVEAVGEEQFWRTGRLERDASFRPWRFSRVGTAASGGRHSFGARLLRPVTLEPGTTSTNDAVTGGTLRAATSSNISPDTAAHLHARHAMLVEGDAGRHASRIGADVEQMVGSRERAYLRPALRGWFASGGASREGDRDWATVAQILASMDAGLGIEGRFDKVTHRIEPTAILAREVAGLSRTPRDERFEWESAARWADAHRQPGWTVGGAILSQELDFDGDWRIGAPLGIIYEGGGFEEAFGEHPQGIAGLELHRPDFDLSGHATCEWDCEDVEWSAGMRASLGAFDLSYRTMRLASDGVDLLSSGALFSRGWTSFDRLQGMELRDSAHPGGAGLHRAALAWRRGRWTTAARGYWRPESDAVGVSVGNTVAVSELGWAVGVRADWRSQPDRLGLFVGLSNAR
ncbi:MAG: hypothetical protein ACOCV2_02460 [Persicimonas sp.]